MPWVEKYRPKNFEEVKGQEEAIRELKRFIVLFPKQKALLLYGPPGTGKTALAHVIANETDSEIFELNASDLRNKEKLQEILKPALEQKSLTKKRKIILVDEIDGISNADMGGLSELLNLINLTPHPIIITANDVWNRRLSLLRKKSKLVQLKEIDYKTMKNVMFNILRKEGLFIDNNVVTNITIKAKGDLRAAINDLQTISKIQDASLIEFDERNKETDIFNSLRQIFKNKPTNEILKIFDSVNMSMDEIILWVEENIPIEYEGQELANAYERLSKTDIFKRRIYKQQYWRFLMYENILLSYGIAASKNLSRTPRHGFTSYKKPTRILKIWLNNQRLAKRKSICQKYAKYVHVGEKRAMKEFPVLKQILKNSQIQKELKLNEEEIVYLQNND